MKFRPISYLAFLHDALAEVGRIATCQGSEVHSWHVPVRAPAPPLSPKQVSAPSISFSRLSPSKAERSRGAALSTRRVPQL
jgi:hypothetical protein